MAGSTSQVLHLKTKSQKIVEEETSHLAAKPHSAVIYSMTHALPTRVGFCVPRISHDPGYMQRLQALLAYEPWVIIQEVNRMAGSIVITYESGIMSDSEMRLYLASLIQSASNVEQTKPATQKPIANASLSQRATHPSVAQDKEDGYETVHVGVSSDPRSVGMGVSLESKSERAGKKPTPTSQSNHYLEKTHQSAKQPATVVYSIAHAIPGRVRFRVPRIAKDSKYVQRLEALLKADPVVTGDRPEGAITLRYRVNNAAASIVITYKSEAMPNSQKRSLSLLEQAISYLSSLIQSAASDTLVPIS
ncbi:hypothetical protein [Mastigocladopsis repens]|uniref:hypothetical protein n=1 Tax=Mastigocladopsis repens TaxID=221287 RepID=UPI000317C7C9|nr:hypothetical protein [Mastigocladopsis repens]